MAKALGSGVPIGAVCARGDVPALTLTPGTHGSTFAGGPLACGLAEATLDTMLHEGVMDNAVKVGEYFRAKLTELSGKHPGTITEVRGMGMINGAELKDNEIGPEDRPEVLRAEGPYQLHRGQRPALHSPADRQRGRG